MSFLKRTRERMFANQNETYGVSATQVPNEIPDTVYEPLMVIGGMPSESDDIAGKPLSGSAGIRFETWISQAKFQRGTFPILNALRYSSNGKIGAFFCIDHLSEACSDLSTFNGKALRRHFRSEIDALRDAIVDYRPEAVITLGSVALWAILDHDMTVSRLTDRQPDHACTLAHRNTFTKFTLFPAYHPDNADKAPNFDAVSQKAFQAARKFLRPASFG